MKCEICGSLLPEKSACCAKCGQSVDSGKEYASVKRHWDAVAAERKRYESKRGKAEHAVRERYRQNRAGRRWLTIILAVVLVVCGWLFLQDTIEDGVLYLNGWWAMEQGDYARAAELFSWMDEPFLDSQARMETCEQEAYRAAYDMAMEEYRQGNYGSAIPIFRSLGTYRDAQAYAKLCAEEILGGIPAPAYHWSFDSDLSEENGIASEPRGDVLVKGVVDSPMGKAAFFDGTGDYVTGGNDANMTENWTLELLIAPNSWEDMTVLAKMHWKTGECPYRVVIREGCVVWEFTTEDGEVFSLRSSPLQIAKRFHHVVLVKNDSAFDLYLDGQWQDGMVHNARILQGDQILTIGDQTHRSEGESISGFRGFIADTAVYDHPFSAVEALVRWEHLEGKAARRWDTSYYALPEEAEQHNFVIYTSDVYDRTEVLVFDIPNQGEEHALRWDADLVCFVTEPDGYFTNAAVYYLEGEEWVLYDYDLVELFASHSEIISSNLDIWIDGELKLPSVLIGGRG